MTDPQRNKYLVTTSYWDGEKRLIRHFEVTADEVAVDSAEDEIGHPILVFMVNADVVAGFNGWDSYHLDGVVTEVQPMPAQIANALETVPDDFQPRARPTRHDRG